MEGGGNGSGWDKSSFAPTKRGCGKGFSHAEGRGGGGANEVVLSQEHLKV